MDSLDQRLIAHLRDDARASTTALAETLGVSRATVQNRMDRLMADGVLLGFTVRLRPEAEEAREQAGRIWAIATLEIRNGGVEPVLAALRALPAVEAAHTTSGRWDLVVELNTGSLTEFSQALETIRAIEGVVATEASLLLHSYQF